MPKTCLKCGHENPDEPTNELAECPKCGAIYTRVEAHLAKQEAVRIAREVEAAAKAEADKKRTESREAHARSKAEAQRRKLLGAGYVSPSSDQPEVRSSTIVKTYKGTHDSAMAAFQAEAHKMASEGYVPITQTWAPGTYGCGAFLVALLLCMVLIGIVVFIYMLLVKPPGMLSVTYELRQSKPVAAGASEVKVCPKCAEQVKAAAIVCRYCGHDFDRASVGVG